MATTLHYEMTVYDTDDSTILAPRAGAAHSDNFIVRTGGSGFSGPLYLQYPKGRRGQLDVLSGITDTGGLTVRVVDAKTGTTNAQRWVTAFCGDANNVSQLVGLKVKIQEALTQDGSTSTVDFFTGRIDEVRLTRKNEITFKLRDMADDLNYTIFTGLMLGEDNQPGAKPTPSMNASDAMYASYGSRPSLAPIGLVDRTAYQGGVTSYGDFITTPWMKATWQVSGTGTRYLLIDEESVVPELRTVTEAWPGVSKDPRSIGWMSARNPYLRIRVRRDTDSTFGDFSWGTLNLETSEQDMWDDIMNAVREFLTEAGSLMPVVEKVALQELPVGSNDRKAFTDFTAGDTVYCYVYSVADPTKGAPIYINNVHPVQLLADILDGKWSTINVDGSARRTFPRDATSFAALIADSSIKRGRWVIKEPAKLNEWIEENIMQQYQIGYRINGSGEMVVFRTTRPVADTLSGVPTIGSNDVNTRSDSGWTQRRKDAVTVVEYKSTTENGPTSVRDVTGSDSMLALIVKKFFGTLEPEHFLPVTEHKNRITYLLAQNNNLKTKGVKKHTVDLTGIHSGFKRFTFTLFGATITWEMFGRAFTERHKETLKALFSHGPIEYNVTCLRTSNTNDVHPGDWAKLQIPDQPDPANAQRGGTRAGLCLERAERGLLVDFTFLDGGPDSTSTAPSLNALTLVTGREKDAINIPIDYSGLGAGTHRVVVEFAISDTSTGTRPSDTSEAWFYAINHSDVAASGVVTKSIYGLPSNTRIWIRARVEPDDTSKLPSSWVYPSGDSYIDTNAGTAPSGLSASNISGAIATIEWTNGESEWDVVVRLAKSTCPAGSYEIIATLPPGTSRFVIAGMAISSTYCVTVAHRDANGGETAQVTHQFVTTGTKETAPVMADVAVIFSE